MATPPLSRQDQQQRTREALVDAARIAFADKGYHRANLDLIAQEAGYSKGAVYSNFRGKAGLFLAVMDANMGVAFGDGGWDLRDDPPEPCGHDGEQVFDEAVEGFALATLEFIATAVRDPQLLEQLGQRLGVLLEGYAAVAERSTSPDSTVDPRRVGALLAALDQGAGLLSLGGSDVIDQRTLRLGMRRLLTAAPDEGPDESQAAGEGEGALHDGVMRERFAAALRDGGGSADPS